MIKFDHSMATHNSKSSEEINLSAEHVRNQERERIIAMVQNKVCFDNRDNGECEHSVCYGMIDLIALIKVKTENAT
jgi:hypothetical protein